MVVATHQHYRHTKGGKGLANRSPELMVMTFFLAEDLAIIAKTAHLDEVILCSAVCTELIAWTDCL